MPLPPVDILRIVAFGDSITASARVSRKWPDQVQQNLLDAGRPAVVFNLGVAGDNTSMGRSRFQDVRDTEPHVALILFGTNDAAIDVWNGQTQPRVSLEEYETNLTFFVEELAKQGTKSILMTPPPMVLTDELRKLYGRAPYTEKGFNFMLDQYVEKVRAMAKILTLPLIDIHRQFLQAGREASEGLMHYLRDGMHPNQAGNDLIAALLIGWFRENM